MSKQRQDQSSNLHSADSEQKDVRRQKSRSYRSRRTGIKGPNLLSLYLHDVSQIV